MRPAWSWSSDLEIPTESAAVAVCAGEGRRQPELTGLHLDGPGLASPRSVVWRRHDGRVRLLVHLGGPPSPAAAEGPWERRLARLDELVPGWDDALILGTFAGLVSAVVAASL